MLKRSDHGDRMQQSQLDFTLVREELSQHLMIRTVTGSHCTVYVCLIHVASQAWFLQQTSLALRLLPIFLHGEEPWYEATANYDQSMNYITDLIVTWGLLRSTHSSQYQALITSCYAGVAERWGTAISHAKSSCQTAGLIVYWHLGGSASAQVFLCLQIVATCVQCMSNDNANSRHFFKTTEKNLHL